jgi:hypothetical protein
MVYMKKVFHSQCHTFLLGIGFLDIGGPFYCVRLFINWAPKLFICKIKLNKLILHFYCTNQFGLIIFLFIKGDPTCMSTTSNRDKRPSL